MTRLPSLLALLVAALFLSGAAAQRLTSQTHGLANGTMHASSVDLSTGLVAVGKTKRRLKLARIPSCFLALIYH